MSRHFGVVVASAALGLMLSACGGGSAEFKEAIKAQCEKSNDKTTDCGCAADALDKELDSKTKALLVALKKGVDAGKSQADALKDAGVSEEEARGIMTTAVPAMMSAAEKCKKT